MIISASRRTDIPAFYSDWLFNRIKEGYALVKNPMNYSQIRKVEINPDAVDCMVFWSKNPAPMLGKLNLLKDYSYYFQFSLNLYENDIETMLPGRENLLDTFKKLSDYTGPRKVIWRYDPVLINDKYTVKYHTDNFSLIAGKIKNHTNKVTFSFIDLYKKIERAAKENGMRELTEEEKNVLAENFSLSARENNLLIDTCTENIDLAKYGIKNARCIDSELISEISGKDLPYRKDKNQRLLCGCAASVDIGEYNTCLNNCLYCYANHSRSLVLEKAEKHNVLSPIITGNI